MMRIAGLPKGYSDSVKKAASERRSTRIATPETQPLKRVQPLSESMVLDEHTLKDLEVLVSPEAGCSLFEMCNFTRTKGGAELLKQRMLLPWSEADRIRVTQESVQFILAHRKAFDSLPSYITHSLEVYERDILLTVTQNNAIEFTIAACSLRIHHERHYRNIVRGVQIACTVIREMRRFIEQEELAESDGELASLLEEMRQLLGRSLIRKIPANEIGSSWHWKILRLDQIFRHHEKATILRLLQLVYEIDALVSMADATRHLGFTLPEISRGAACVQAEGLSHPLVPNAIANPVSLNQTDRVLFLTGPNMAGKTTYLRAFATALYFAHLGMGVPARQFSFVPMQRLFSSISLNDDLHSGVSYFRAEALRIKAVAEAIAEGYRVVAVMDEPFKGTNVKDAFDVSLEVLKRLAGKKDCLFMFSSHLIELDEQFEAEDPVCRHHFEAQEKEGRLVFDYLLRPGVSSQRLGVRVLEEEGVFRILDS